MSQASPFSDAASFSFGAVVPGPLAWDDLRRAVHAGLCAAAAEGGYPSLAAYEVLGPQQAALVDAVTGGAMRWLQAGGAGHAG